MSAEKNPESAIARAVDHGVDIGLLKKNLQMTPSARVQQAQAALDSIIALQNEVKQWRANQQAGLEALRELRKLPPQ